MEFVTLGRFGPVYLNCCRFLELLDGKVAKLQQLIKDESDGSQLAIDM